MTLTRRRVVRGAAVAATAVLGFTLAGCSSNSGQTGSSTAASSAAATTHTTLTVWADPTKTDAIKAVIGPFEKQYNVTINVVQKPADSFTTNFIQQAPTGKGPDVIEDASNNIGNYADNGVIAPITIGNTGDFSKNAISNVTYKNQTWGMPAFVENVELYRNTSLVPNAATTWDQVVANGQKLVSSGKTKYAVAVPPDQYHLYGLMGSYGIGVYKLNNGVYDTSQVNLSGSGGDKWAQALNDWGKKKLITTSLTYPIGETAFEKGQVAYFMTGPWALADFAKVKNMPKFAIDEIPSAGGQPATPFIGSQAFMVSKYSKNQIIANRFVATFLGTEPVQLSIAKAGQRAPALTAAFNQVVSSDANLGTFGKLADQQGVPFPNSTAFNALFTAMGNTETAILQGKAADPASAWQSMVKKNS